MIDDLERRQAWLAFASAAISGLGAVKGKKPQTVAEQACDIADAMLEAYEHAVDRNFVQDEEDNDADAR